MDVKRVEYCSDARFSQTSILQHGAYLVDGEPCAFEIVDECSARVAFHDYSRLDEVIGRFRYFAEHITRFYDMNGGLIASFPPVTAFEVELEAIQPSQFYIDEAKLAGVSTFVRSGSDVIVPVSRWDSGFVAQDGHTRMYRAAQMGIDSVRAFIAEDNDDLIWFAREAQRRGIRHVRDMEIVSHQDYVEKWHRFCDEHFAEQGEEG